MYKEINLILFSKRDVILPHKKCFQKKKRENIRICQLLLWFSLHFDFLCLCVNENARPKLWFVYMSSFQFFQIINTKKVLFDCDSCYLLFFPISHLFSFVLSCFLTYFGCQLFGFEEWINNNNNNNNGSRD